MLREEPAGGTIRAWRGTGDHRVGPPLSAKVSSGVTLRHRIGAMHNAGGELPTCLTLLRSLVVSRAAKLLGCRLYRDRSRTSCRL
jgi:hypothetical protein